MSYPRRRYAAPRRTYKFKAMPVIGKLARFQPVVAEFKMTRAEAIDALIAAGVPGIVERDNGDRYDAVAYVYPDGRVVDVPALRREPGRVLFHTREEVDAVDEAKREARKAFLAAVATVADPTTAPKGFQLQCGKCHITGHGTSACAQR